MGYGLNVEIEGLSELKARLAASPKVMDQASHQMLEMGTFIAEGEAKQQTPINDGVLRGSITSKVTKEGNEMVGIVGTNLDYAPYQEYGTGIYGPKGVPITPKQSSVLRFKTRDGQIVFARSVAGTKPRKFMYHGLQAVKSNLGKIQDLGIAYIKRALGF